MLLLLKLVSLFLFQLLFEAVVVLDVEWCLALDLKLLQRISFWLAVLLECLQVRCLLFTLLGFLISCCIWPCSLILYFETLTDVLLI